MSDGSGRPAEIAVIVVNYRTADLAIEAVESVLARDHGGRAVEVHLVDNGSPGDDAERLRQAHHRRGWAPRVTLHLEAVNHGFGRANNLVLARLAAGGAAPDKVFLLNPDARLENETLGVLAGFLDSHPRAGAAGAAIRLPDGTPVTAAFRFPTLASEFEGAVNLGPVSRVLSRWRTPLPADLATGRVDWVAGAVVMFRRDALDQAGFFDPAYFLYYEEVDLMRELDRRGWQTWYVAEARAIHHEGAATNVTSRALRHRRPPYVYQSWRIYFRKNHGRVYALAAAGLVALGAAINHVTSLVRRREPSLPLRFVQDHARHVILPLFLSGKARAPDPHGTVEQAR